MYVDSLAGLGLDPFEFGISAQEETGHGPRYKAFQTHGAQYYVVPVLTLCSCVAVPATVISFRRIYLPILDGYGFMQPADPVTHCAGFLYS